MPAEQCVWRRDRGDFAQGRASDSVGSARQMTAIVVGEAQATVTELTPQEPVLFDQVRGCVPFAAIEPAGQYTDHHLQRRVVHHERELIPRLPE